MPEVVPSRLRGLLLHDSRFCEANRIRATSEAGPFYGVPEVSQGAPAARLEAYTGASDAANGSDGDGYADTWVEVVRAGGSRPGPGAAQIVWTDEEGGTQRGWLPPNVATGFSWVAFEGGALSYHWPAALALQDGSLLTAYVYSGTATEIRAVRTPPQSAPGSEVTVTDQPDLDWSSIVNSGPALVQLPAGRILCLYITRVNSVFRMNVAASDDNGETWTDGVLEAGGFAHTGDALGLSVAYHQGWLTALIHTTNGAEHYASDDYGASWTQVESTLSIRCPVVIAAPGGGVLLIYSDDTTTHLSLAQKPSPLAPWDLDAEIVLQGISTTPPNAAVDIDNDRAYIAACVAQDGSIYVAYRSSTATPGCRIKLCRFNPVPTQSGSAGFSADLLWENPLSSTEPWDGEPLDWQDNDERMIMLALAPFDGGLRLLSNFEGTGATVKEGSIGSVQLGGWSSQTFSLASFGALSNSASYGICYVPFLAAFDVAGWTRTGTGVGTVTSGGYQQSFGAATTDYYTVTGGAGLPLVAWVSRTHVSGGSKTDRDSFIGLIWTDGSSLDHQVTLRFSSTGARLVDVNNGNATLGTDVSRLTAGAAYDWLFYLNGDKVYIWYKRVEATLWVAAYALTPTNGGGAPAAHTFRWGTDSANASTVQWRFVGVSLYDTPSGAIRSSEIFGLRGRGLGTLPVALTAGLSVRALRAPLMRGEGWAVPVAHAYGADALDPLLRPSPRLPWRSTDTTEQVVAWDFGISSGFGSPAVGLSIRYPVGRTFYLEGSANDSTWTTLITLDAAAAWSGLGCSRSGDVLTRSSGTAQGYVRQDELVGGYALIESAGTTYLRRIAANTEGIWQASGKIVRIRIEDAGSCPSSGTLSVIRPHVTGITWAVGTTYRYYRLRVAALTLDAGSPGYLGAGAVVIGPLIPFGTQYSWGRSISTTQNQEVTTLPSGARAVRQLGPPRRAVEFGWEDGIPSQSLYRSYATYGVPDWIAAVASGLALGTRRAVDLLDGISARQEGARLPVVYLPSLAYDAGGTTVSAQEAQIYGRIISDTVARVATVGDEEEDEVQTVGTIRIEEEI